MRTVLNMALLLLLSTITLASHAQHKAHSAQDVINKQDADKDGKISKAEAKGKLNENFDKVDADRDGYITLQELQAIREKINPNAIVDKMDADGDGKISKTEAKGRIAKRFDKIDSNKDGFITEAELAKAQERAMSRKR